MTESLNNLYVGGGSKNMELELLLLKKKQPFILDRSGDYLIIVAEL